MKIIKQGKKPDPKVVRFECNECGSVFEENVKKCNMLCCFSDGPVYDIECPTCGKRVKSDKILTSSGEKEDSTAIPAGIKARGEKVRRRNARLCEARTCVAREEGMEKKAKSHLARTRERKGTSIARSKVSSFGLKAKRLIGGTTGLEKIKHEK